MSVMCPFRMAARDGYPECIEEACALYDRSKNQCGISSIITLADKMFPSDCKSDQPKKAPLTNCTNCWNYRHHEEDNPCFRCIINGRSIPSEWKPFPKTEDREENQ